VLFGWDCTDETDQGRAVGDDADAVVRRRISRFQAFLVGPA
jgi:hypothetical protein